MTTADRLRHASLITAVTLLVALPAGAQESYELREAGFRQVEAPEAGSAEAALNEIRRLIAEEQPAEAEELADDWIKSHRRHRRLPEAYLLRADAKAARKHYYRALYDYEYLVRRYPDSEQFHTALDRELRIAQTFAGGTKRRLWGMRIMPAQGEAEELFIRVQERAPASDTAQIAGKELADFYYRRSEMILAAEAYGLFLANYPDSQWREHAMIRRIDANLATFKGPRFDATGLLEARRRLEDFKQSYPGIAEKHGADERLARIDESLAHKALVAARWYHKQNRMVSARFMYQRVIDAYPHSAAARAAIEQLEQINPTADAPTTPPVSGEADTAESAPEAANPIPAEGPPPAPEAP